MHDVARARAARVFWGFGRSTVMAGNPLPVATPSARRENKGRPTVLRESIVGRRVCVLWMPRGAGDIPPKESARLFRATNFAPHLVAVVTRRGTVQQYERVMHFA